MYRYVKLALAYDGSAFFGFQYQPEIPTIQGELEKALKLILKQKTRIVGAGRTDTGVHAVEQVVLFKTKCPIPLEKLVIGLNSILGGALRVCRAEEVNSDFHPCFSACGKHYRYLFKLVDESSPFLERFYWQVTAKLDTTLMNRAASLLIGEHDFAAFAKSPAKYESTVRSVFYAKVTSILNNVIVFDVKGNGFLHNMVRNMAKALYLVGSCEMAPEELDELYRNQNRRRLGAPAPPGGLYLMKVMY